MLPTITVDVGTTSVKLCLFDAHGDLQASARDTTPTTTDSLGEIYQVDILQDLIRTFILALPPEVRGTVKRIAITGVGESGGLVRPDGSLASPMILWHDHRGADLLTGLSGSARELVYRVTGLPVNANYGLSKVAWAVKNGAGDEAEAKWLNVSEYLAAWMTGERWSEYSLASRTMALDLQRRAWSAEVAALLGLSVEIFPELQPATHGSPITRSVADRFGVPANVHVHVAGHDHMVGAIGADLHHGELLNSTGTTEGLLFSHDAPSLDDASAMAMLANGISCIGSDFTLFASIPTGGSAFATLQSMLGLPITELNLILEDLHHRYLAGDIVLENIPLVLPQFRGSPPPTKRAAARGMIAGLQTDVAVDDIVFGCFLGMVVQFRDVLELFPMQPDRIKVIGPASKNPLWLQLKADLLGTPLSVSQFPEVVSRGAQALASETRSDWDGCKPFEVLPDETRHGALAHWYADVRPLWEHMKAAPV